MAFTTAFTARLPQIRHRRERAHDLLRHVLVEVDIKNKALLPQVVQPRLEVGHRRVAAAGGGGGPPPPPPPTASATATGAC